MHGCRASTSRLWYHVITPRPCFLLLLHRIWHGNVLFGRSSAMKLVAKCLTRNFDTAERHFIVRSFCSAFNACGCNTRSRDIFVFPLFWPSWKCSFQTFPPYKSFNNVQRNILALPKTLPSHVMAAARSTVAVERPVRKNLLIFPPWRPFS